MRLCAQWLKATLILAVMALTIIFLFGGMACKSSIKMPSLGRPSKPGTYINVGRGLEKVDSIKFLKFRTGLFGGWFPVSDFNSKAFTVKPGVSKITVMYVMTPTEKTIPGEILDATTTFSIQPLKINAASSIPEFEVAGNLPEQQAKAVESDKSDPRNGYLCFEYTVPPPGTSPEGCYAIRFVGGFIGVRQ